MEELRERFLEEAHEMMGKLESALLELEANPKDKERIDEVFRVMHTLKGTGGMFGFDALSEHTHDLESLYDKVRSMKLPLTKELIDITFRSLDLIGKLLATPNDEKVLVQKNLFAREIKERFLNQSLPEVARSVEEIYINDDVFESEKYTYHIHFQPGEGVLKDGTHPLYLIDELLDFGVGKAFAHFEKIPEFDQLIPDLAYLYWDFLLVTSEPEESLMDVFIFVEDNSVIEIRKLADENLINNQYFESEAEKTSLYESFSREKLDNLIVAFKESYKSVEEKPSEQESVPTGVNRQVVNEMNSIRVGSVKLDNMMDLVSELVTAQARLDHLSKRLKNSDLQLLAEDFEKLFRQLRTNTLEMRLIPIYTLLTRFKRMVRDVGYELNKQVNFRTTGTETELDKFVIEMLYDPLMHIIRNSLDHGIELPEERSNAGKRPEGIIEILTYYSGSYVVIEVRDDGRGIDPDEIRKKAIEKNLILPSDQLEEEEIMNLIFNPGFSTSDKVSQLSGRGVGMDVVRKNITELRGYVELDSEKGKGTTVRIRLPLTLSIIDGLLVLIGDSRYLIPLENIKRIYPLDQSELDKTGFSQVVVKEGRQIQFVHLIQEFGIHDFSFEKAFLLVFSFENKEIGFVINGIEGKHQAVIKPLNQFVKGKELFSGATVLGDGKVALVIDPYRIMQQYTNTTQ
ncbi:MAG: chemotaxis protein CheA [Bacteroidales bacterium]|nr:chemotaxis protein CheA [Bacteroidales bacterium]